MKRLVYNAIIATHQRYGTEAAQKYTRQQLGGFTQARPVLHNPYENDVVLKYAMQKHIDNVEVCAA